MEEEKKLRIKAPAARRINGSPGENVIDIGGSLYYNIYHGNLCFDLMCVRMLDLRRK